MTTQVTAENLPAVESLRILLARHGVVRVLMALPNAMLKPSGTKVLQDHHLSDHLRRDIGLHRDRPRHLWEQR